MFQYRLTAYGENPECLCIDDFFIFFHVEENEAKENARVPLDPARRHGGRSARKLPRLGGSDSPRALIRPSSPMLGAEQREIQNQSLKKRFKASP